MESAKTSLFFCNLAYTTPSNWVRTVIEVDALEHVRAKIAEFHDCEIEAPLKAKFFNSQDTGRGSTGSQCYVLVYSDRIVFAIRGTETSSMDDVAADARVSRAWFADVGYGRCAATGYGGIVKLEPSESSTM